MVPKISCTLYPVIQKMDLDLCYSCRSYGQRMYTNHVRLRSLGPPNSLKTWKPYNGLCRTSQHASPSLTLSVSFNAGGAECQKTGGDCPDPPDFRPTSSFHPVPLQVSTGTAATIQVISRDFPYYIRIAVTETKPTWLHVSLSPRPWIHGSSAHSCTADY